MLSTVEAIVREGRIELKEKVDLVEGTELLAEGTELLVTILPDDQEFWLRGSEPSLAAVWQNDQDDVYDRMRT